MELTDSIPSGSQPPTPVAHMIASALRRFAERLHPSTIAEPTPEEIKRVELLAAQRSLSAATSEMERWTYTVQMLQARVERLSGGLPV